MLELHGKTRMVFGCHAQGLFLLRARGPGTLAVCAFGAIERYDLRRGEIRDIDNGHLVAWSADMQYR